MFSYRKIGSYNDHGPLITFLLFFKKNIYNLYITIHIHVG